MSVPRDEASTSDGLAAPAIAEDLVRWAAAYYSREAEIQHLARMPGHSGITYSFTVVDGTDEEALVLRVPPKGVRQKNNLDVVRFAPILELAADAGIPVPRVRWYSRDEQWFGTSYLMVSRVSGTPLPDVFQLDQNYPTRERVDAIFKQAVAVLAAIHALDTRTLQTSGWATPVGRTQDIDYWRPLLMKSEVPDEVRRTEELGVLLLRTAPTQSATTLVHGDFYSNNWMIDEGRLAGVLDWENSTLSDPYWDLGWMATIYDPACWGPTRAPSMTWHPGPNDFYEWYEAATGKPVRRPQWYQALMNYRLACITPSKVRLHRTGRRADPVWEIFAEAIPYQLDRAFELLKTFHD